MVDTPDDARPLVLIAGVNPLAQVGGHESYVLAHALAARAAGYMPHIFSVGSTAGSLDTEFGVVHQVRTPLRHFLVAPVHRRAVAGAVANLLARSNHAPPHVVHGFGTWSATAVSACEKLRSRGIAAVPVASAYTAVAHEWDAVLDGLTLREDPRANLWFRAWHPWVRTAVAATERHGYRRVRLMLVNYDSVAELLRAAHGSGAEIRRLPYAAPAAFRAAPDVASRALPGPVAALGAPDAPLLVSVSRHDPRKGLHVLLRALAQLQAAGVAFRACLVGPGRLLDAHRGLAASLGLSGRVAIPGRVEDVGPYLHHADVFVLPSLQEGSGSVSLIEALEAGRAVVASRCDGIPEDLLDGRDALLVAPGDPGALAEALTRVMGDSALRATLAGRSRRLYNERFAAGPFVAALRQTYAELESSVMGDAVAG
jgi:glycosyltransferase involved in cell wall biosynthesis